MFKRLRILVPLILCLLNLEAMGRSMPAPATVSRSAGVVAEYGYRYYGPEVGRWINRDPIDEEGGENLYSTSDNDSVNCIDPIGLNPLNFLRKLLALPFDALDSDLFRAKIIGEKFTKWARPKNS